MNTVEFPGLGLSFNVDPVAFKLGSLQIYWYGIMIALGVVLAFVVGMRKAKQFGVNQDRLINAAFIGCIFGIIGARVYYVLFTEITYFMQSGEHFYTSFWDIINIRDGGLAIYGGLILGIASAAVFCKIKKYDFLGMADVAAFGIPLAQALGRWGNFFNQEAWGSNTDLSWGMTGNVIRSVINDMNAGDDRLADVMDPTMPVHPCFFYEFLWCLICFGLISLWAKKRVFRGEMILTYGVLYGIGRFFIEGLRTDSLTMGGVRVSQLLSALLVIAGIIIIYTLRSRVKAGHNEKLALEAAVVTGSGFEDVSNGPVVVRDGEVVVDEPKKAKKAKKKVVKPIESETPEESDGGVTVIVNKPSAEKTSETAGEQQEDEGSVTVIENKKNNEPEEKA